MEEEEELMGPGKQAPLNNHTHLAHSEVEVSAPVRAGPCPAETSPGVCLPPKCGLASARRGGADYFGFLGVVINNNNHGLYGD